jgi:hypothetical protein
MKTTRSWYRIAMAGDSPAPRIVVASGTHLGEAIANAVRHVGRGAWAVAAASADAGEVPLGESVGKHHVVDHGPAPDLPTGLRWALGVVPSLGDAERAATLREGWARRPGELGVLEALVGGDRLDEVFLDLVEHLPVADNLEVKVLDHHDGGGETEVWLSPRIDVKRALRWLDDHDIELLHNGHVEVSIYLREQGSTLALTEHQTIVWLSEDAELTEEVAGWLGAAGLAEVPELTTLARLGHFHWRPAATSPRRRLCERLRRLGLRQVDSWKGGAAAAGR